MLPMFRSSKRSPLLVPRTARQAPEKAVCVKWQTWPGVAEWILYTDPGRHGVGRIRSIMGEDVPDRGLINVSELSLTELLGDANESALATALNRILVSTTDGLCNGFNASI